MPSRSICSTQRSNRNRRSKTSWSTPRASNFRHSAATSSGVPATSWPSRSATVSKRPDGGRTANRDLLAHGKEARDVDVGQRLFTGRPRPTSGA